jgi:hypothetical protein
MLLPAELPILCECFFDTGQLLDDMPPRAWSDELTLRGARTVLLTMMLAAIFP